MSGPKVVRVVTREERIVICEGLLARLDAALEEWERVGHRNDTVSENDISHMRARYEELTQALAADRFDVVQRQAPVEVQFLQEDQERRLTIAIDKRRRVRRAEQRTKEISAELRATLERARSAPADEISEAQRVLAQRLKECEDPQTFTQWLAENPSVVDAGADALEQRFAEASVLLEGTEIAEFEMRLQRLDEEPSPSRRALLQDGLTIDLAQAVKKARFRTELRTRLRALMSELHCLRSDIAARAAESLSRSLDGETSLLAKLEADATRILQVEREALAARARRDVVLKGLASLGYQVNETLETAWVLSGRVVVRRPSQPDYGVELGGAGDKGRIQARVVAFRAADVPADKARDTNAERLWCSDFASLETQVASTGSELVIEKALPIGAVPVKSVAESAGETRAAEDAPALRERTLPRS